MTNNENGERRRKMRDMPITRLIPNILTLTSLCLGLTSMRFALQEKWEAAVLAIVIASVFDILDGRVARMLNITSKFGAELDSLSDLISFGVAPAFLTYLWVLQDAHTGFSWVAVLVFVVCAALRLARFNTMIDDHAAPAWAKSYFTGVPTPGGAGLALLPVFLVLEFGPEVQWPPTLVAFYLIIIGGLMVSRVPTLSLKGRRVAPVLVAPIMAGVALLIASLITNIWMTLSVVGSLYVLSIPYGWFSFRCRQKREMRNSNV